MLVGRPTSRGELLSAADHEFDRLWTAVAAVPTERRNLPGCCDEWSVKDVLCHLGAWHDMVLEWDRVGREGGEPEIPAAGRTWRQLPELNHEIHLRCRPRRWSTVTGQLRASHGAVMSVVSAYDDDTLVTPGRVAWTGTTTLGSYFVSATSSHYAWATKLVRRWARAEVPPTESPTA